MPSRGDVDEMLNHSYFSIINSDRHFVFMTATAENSLSLKYVVTKGCEDFIALADNSGRRLSQVAKGEEVYLR